ncbi:MAG TPA: hypothetical protein VK913_07585, partial [Erythrobacter sp.]|nr:hypothetical protein [Erythrobacter sp.]
GKAIFLMRDMKLNVWKGDAAPQGAPVDLKKGCRGYVLSEPQRIPGSLILALAEYNAAPVSLDQLLKKPSSYREVILNFATFRANVYIDV